MQSNDNKNKDMNDLLEFINENKKAGKLSKEDSIKIEKLWNKYKLDVLNNNCSIITVDIGFLGSIIIRNIISSDSNSKLKYESGSYDYVSIKCETRKILYTDFSDTEPYNRQCGLYCDGESFKSLGDPIKVTDNYREFDKTFNHKSNITFGVWGFMYNDFYGNVRFGMCINKNNVNEFVSELKKILNK